MGLLKIIFVTTMIRLLFIFTSISLLFSCRDTSSVRDCQKFSTGTYEFTYQINDIEKKGVFKRFKNLNIDYYDGIIDSSSVKWINDCEFILKKINPKSIQEKDPIHIKIIETNDTSYVFEFKLAIKKMNTSPLVMRGTAVKVQEF